MNWRSFYKGTKEYRFADAMTDTVFLSAVSLLCAYAALWMAQDVFPKWQIAPLAKMFLNLSVFFTVAVYEAGIKAMPRFQWICRLLLPLAYGVLGYRYIKPLRIDLEDGGCALATDFLALFNKHLHKSVSIWQGKREFMGFSLTVYMIGAVMGLLLFTLITGRRIFLAALPTAVLSAELLVGYTPQWKGVACFFAGVLLLFSGEGDSRRHMLKAHVSRYGHPGMTWFWRQVPALCIAAAVVVLTMACSIFLQGPSAALLSQAPQVRQFQTKAEQTVKGVVSAFVTKGSEAIDNRQPRYTGKEVMKVTATAKPVADLLLKGFCGTDYRDGSWIYDGQSFAEACGQAGVVEEDAAESLLQSPYEALYEMPKMWELASSSIYPADGDPDDSEEIAYRITYTGIHDRYAYLPYVVDVPSLQEGSALGDASWQKGRWKKETEVQGWNHLVDIYAVARAEEDSEKSIFQWYDLFTERAYLDTSDCVTGVEEYLRSMEAREDHEVSAEMAGFVAEGLYGMFFRYQKMLEYRQDIVMRNLYRLNIASYVTAILQEYQTYSTKLEALPEGADAVDHFLMESHTGYCVHFASAAVLMLREAGIPARYVSGYVARQSSFHKTKDGYVASVKDRNAHAWAEIYLEQIGWLPVDVTPAAETGSGTGQPMVDANAQDRTPQQGVQTEKPAEQQTTPKEEEGSADEEEVTQHWWDPLASVLPFSGGSQMSEDPDGLFKMAVLGLLTASLFFVFVIFIYQTIRRGMRRYQEAPKKDLRNGEHKKAVLRINRRIYRRLRLRGKARDKDMTDRQYGHLLGTVYDEVLDEDWQRYLRIVQEAAFSKGELKKEDAYACYRMYQQICHQKKRKRG